MNISDICIRRPVFTWVLVAIPVVLGARLLLRAGRRSVSQGRFSRSSRSRPTCRAASAEEMETERHPAHRRSHQHGLRRRRTALDDARRLTTIVTVQFVLEKDGDVAAQEVRDKISSIMKQLPQGHGPAAGQQVRPRCRPDHDHRRLRPARRARSDRNRQASKSRK